eukprot:TRINITY_DN23985_c0_g1_i1.p1 TRINITY_DN23985_c0_g1~~TRINITY_DN23985_c0_g1_i1.p1  ORF type:complete len:861 (+),score=191.80 TRINITY_DN23985_c0_g1_i1:87-2585(+)
MAEAFSGGDSRESEWLQSTLASLTKMPKAPSLTAALNDKHRLPVPLPLANPRHRQDRRDSLTPLPAEVDTWLSTTLASAPKPKPRRLSTTRPASWADPLNQNTEGEPGSDVEQQAARARARSDGSMASEGPRATMAKLSSILPDAPLVLERLRGGEEGFSAQELSRIRVAFQRFRVPHSAEIHKDDLGHVLKHLGYTQIDAEVKRKVADEITEFSTLEVSEFEAFVGKIAKVECAQFKETFERFDEDGSGELDPEELTKLLYSLGITPLRKTINQAIELVDLDGDGQLNFEELVLLMAVYRNTEGFTREELDSFIQTFHAQMEEGDGEASLPAERLAATLTKLFGPACATDAMELASEATGRKGDDDENRDEPPLGLDFSELLVWARRLRDKEIEAYRKEFLRFDADNSGFIDEVELQSVVAALGFTLSRATILEHIMEAKKKENNGDLNDTNLDFDQFAQVMEIFRKTDGFSREELDHLQQTFDRFDEDGSDDIDVIELSDMFHYMGHSSSISDIQKLINNVDYNGNGSLDFREFVRLMRLHREDELANVKEVFHSYAVDGKIRKRDLFAACAASGFGDEEQELHGETNGVTEESLAFDDFVIYVDALRAARVKELRKRAGFTEAEIQRFEKLFTAYDPGQTGILDAQGLHRLLVDLGFQFRTVEEQQAVMQHVDLALEAAIERGVTEAKTGTISFWVVVQLLRTLYRRDEKQTMTKLTRATERSQFSHAEVQQFREVFMSWGQKDKVFEEEELGTPTGTSDDLKSISQASLRRLLRSLGLKLDSTNRTDLEAKAHELNNEDQVDFADFLLIMRWMMDTNFADIQRVSQRS